MTNKRKTLLLLAFLLSILPLKGQINDIQTSFEFDDLDGRFRVGQCFGCALFENGQARTPANNGLYLSGTHAWVVEAGETGHVEFITPVNRLRFFFKDETEEVSSILSLYAPDGSIIDTYDGTSNGSGTNGFTEVSLNGVLIKAMTLTNQKSPASPPAVTVIENLEASFDQQVAITAVDTFYLPRFGDGDFSVAGKKNTFTTEGILTNTGPFSIVELHSFSDQGVPIAITIEAPNRVTDSQFSFELFEGENLTFQTVGLGDRTTARNLVLGYWQVNVSRVLSDDQKPGTVGATAVFRRSQSETGGPILLFETGIPAVRPIREFTLSLDSLGKKNTGLAIVNPPRADGESDEVATATIILSVWDVSGMDLITKVEFDLLPGEATSRFISEYIRDFGDDIDPSIWNDLQEYQGVVTVRSTRAIAAMTLRQNNPQSVFPQGVPSLTTFPVVQEAADSKIGPMD